MRAIVACVISAVCSFQVYALDGEPFYPANAEIAWSAPTNHLPKPLWIYKVVEQTFTTKVVSNVMALGVFSPNEKKRGEKGVIHYESKDGTRYLSLSAATGWIEYRDEKARAGMADRVDGVPTEKEAYDRALAFLPKLGIDRSDLATKPGTNELLVYRDLRQRGRMDDHKASDAKEAISRGVIFVRRVNGVDFTGLGTAGGVRIVFGNHGRVAELEMVWRNLKPHQTMDISTALLMERIKLGQAVKTSPPEIDAAEIKKLTITKITPYYLGARGDERQDFVQPFAKLQVKADIGKTNVAFELACPILGRD